MLQFKKYWKDFYKHIVWIIILIIFDQSTKYWCITNLINKVEFKIEITKFLDFAYSWNYGISFGLLKGYYQYSNIAFLIINSLIVLYLFYVLFKINDRYSIAGYRLIIGGAIGNLIDRYARGAVFDFIYLHYKDYHFPIFNLADSFISIGAIFLLFHFLDKKY
jgi:signal peptidase II